MKIPKDNTAAVFGADHKPRPEVREKGISVHVEPGIWFNYVAFNMDDPVVGGAKNKFLRQAIALAYDEGPTIDKFYLGVAVKAESGVAPGVSGYDPKYVNPYREFNLAKAKEILAKNGHPGGQGIPELVYDTKGDTTQLQIAEYFQRQVAALGIQVKLNRVSWPELLGRIKKKQVQVYGISWVYDYPDAENAHQLLYGPNESPGSNGSNYKNPKFDALYEKLVATPESPARVALVRQMRDLAAEDVPWITTVHQAESRLTHPWLKNFKINQFDHNVEKYLRVDAEERKRALR